MPKRSRGRVAREPGAKAESEAEADADDDESAVADEDAQSAHNTDNEEPQSQDDC